MTRAGTAKLAGVVVALAALVVFPLVFTNPSVTTIAVFTLLFMASATAWNAFSGYSGYISLGHAAFFGTGAYILAIMAVRLGIPAGLSMFALVPVAGMGAAVVAVPFGLIALRTRRHTFVVITIAVFFTFQLLAFNLSITDGSSGIQVPSPNWTAATYNNPYYYVSLGIVIFATLVSWALRRSVFGLQLLAIRDDEDRARGLGVPVGRVKLIAFVLSAVPVGMCGAVYAYFLGQIFPQFAFNPLFDLSVALMALFGGIGTLTGPLLGALVLESLQQYFAIQFTNDDLYLVLYGALFLLVLLWMPRGVIPTAGDLLRRLKARRAVGAAAGRAALRPSGSPHLDQPAPSTAVPGGGLVASGPDPRS
ncbi:MAG TPA: branched-chain amino acid ABC transporter permease [Acidimicrobiales bacterium]|nr:branched-chain amino acid ABC transporter permease [Acidimicrobiales bacterium]